MTGARPSREGAPCDAVGHLFNPSYIFQSGSDRRAGAARVAAKPADDQGRERTSTERIKSVTCIGGRQRT